MQIKSYLGFVKPNSTQHFTFTALSAAQDLTINPLEFLHHALQNVTFGLLSYLCYNIHSRINISIFHMHPHFAEKKSQC